MALTMIDATGDEAGGLVPGRINADDVHVVALPPSMIVEVSNFGDQMLHVAWDPDQNAFTPWRPGTQVIQGGETVQIAVPTSSQDNPHLALRPEAGAQTQYQIRRMS